MSTINYNICTNTEREKSNLLCLIKLTLNALIDQTSSSGALPNLDDRNPYVINFILTLERILCLRMRATWLSERRSFWDFIRPACIGSCQQTIIERVEEVSQTRSLKDKGRAWIKLALMEKKLSELLKLAISDNQLVQKFYYEDSILQSSQAFILCDQLAGLNAVDFGFCFKENGPILAPILLNDAEIDVIDLTPFLSYKSKQIKQCFDDENQSSSTIVTDEKDSNSTQSEIISLEKYKLEVEQRKYFEELLQHRERELQQIKIRHETLKSERENEIVQLENIILELQLELRTAREEIELKRKRSQSTFSTTPPKTNSQTDNQKSNSPSTPTNKNVTPTDSNENLLQNNDNKTLNLTDPSVDKYESSNNSRTTTNTDDEQYEMIRHQTTNNNTENEIKPISSPEIISSPTSLSTPSLVSSDEDEQHVETVTTTTPDETKTISDQSSRNESS